MGSRDEHYIELLEAQLTAKDEEIAGLEADKARLIELLPVKYLHALKPSASQNTDNESQTKDYYPDGVLPEWVEPECEVEDEAI